MPRRLTEKEREIVEACCFQPHYSGDDSRKFWHEVNMKTNDRTLYDLGCALQDLESRVLRAVNEGVRIRAVKMVRMRQRKAARALGVASGSTK
jgi:hypothetical protein